jgi:hypothetical protein
MTASPQAGSTFQGSTPGQRELARFGRWSVDSGATLAPRALCGLLRS